MLFFTVHKAADRTGICSRSAILSTVIYRKHTECSLHAYTMKSLRKIMKNRTFEDLSVITSIETIFNNKRGSVFQMPKPGTDVILLVSGGLDSVLTWGLLLEKYRLKVHPLFLNKGEGRASQEERSFNFFSRYYSRRYPSLSKAPVKQTVYLPQKEILTALKTPFDNLSG